MCTGISFVCLINLCYFPFFLASQGRASTSSFFGRQNSQTGMQSGSQPAVGKDGVPNPTGEDTEDTMKNLRKTFAGIFGDM